MAPKEKVYRNEAAVKKEVKRLLDKHEWFWWCPPANGFGRTGISDFNTIKNGVFLAIETKFGANQPSVMQQGFLRSIAAEDGLAFVVCEKRVAWLASWLEAFDVATALAGEGKIAPQDVGADMLNAVAELIKGY